MTKIRQSRKKYDWQIMTIVTKICQLCQNYNNDDKNTTIMTNISPLWQKLDNYVKKYDWQNYDHCDKNAKNMTKIQQFWQKYNNILSEFPKNMTCQNYDN